MSKAELIKKICYTDLVYERINKKLNLSLKNDEIEILILDTIEETDESTFLKKGKNIYISNRKRNVRLT